MTLMHANALSGILLAHLAASAVRNLGLAAAASIILTVLRVKTTSTRLFTWTAVLYASLAIPFLSWQLPAVPIPLPALLESGARKVTEAMPSRANVTPPRRESFEHLNSPSKSTTEDIATLPALRIRERSHTGNQNSQLSISWEGVATAIYMAVGLVLLIRLLIGLALTHKLVKASEEIRDQRITSRMPVRARLRRSSSLLRARESRAISVPVTVGPIHSTILLPSTWREWDDEKLDAVIAHERSHVARRDALSQSIALLHRAIFWFSPFAWWLNQHIGELAEQASDEAALSAGADRNQYARTLLGFFEALQTTPNRIWWHGVSMANAGPEKRLENILAWRGAVTMRLKKSAVVVIITLAVPLVFVAAAARPVQQESSHQANSAENPVSPAAPGTHLEPPPPSGAPASPSLPPAPKEGVSNPGPEPEAPVAPPMPSAPVGPGPVGVGPLGQNHNHNHGYWYSYGNDDEQRFVIVTGKNDSLTMSGSSEDARHVENLRKQISGDFIWFQRDEKSYIIRDQATVDRARKLWAPQEELGKKQEELGRQQEALGKQQEELGARMEKIQVKVPDMTAQLDKLRAELKALTSGATQEQIGNLQSEIGELQSNLGDVQSHAGDQQSKVGEEMSELGEKQGKLGEQQGELGRQQGELAEKAGKQMKELFDEALKNGTAKPEPGESGGASL